MDIYQEIAKKRAAGQAFVLATIVKTVGSSPRQVGAKMLVYPDGSITGTIGGGVFEKLVIDDSRELLKGSASHLLKTYRFEEEGPESTGMLCGGTADVFMELSARPERLVIFGGGHIGRDVVRLAAGMDFLITVVDDRPEILQEYKSPVETILTDADFKTNIPPVGPNCYVVIVTRGHRGDQSVLGQVIGQGCAYIGMIGSKAKVGRVFKTLEESGIDRALLEEVHAPIGLDIGGEGPYEIAISIIAEIIAIRKKARQAAS